MAINLPGKEFKESIKSLNEVLEQEGKPKIKFIGAKKEIVVENFINTVLDYIETKRAYILPDNVIKFYNEYVVAPDEKETIPRL